MRSVYLVLLVLLCILYSCSGDDDPEVFPVFSKGDTLVYFPFDGTMHDRSKWNNSVVPGGEPVYVTGINGKSGNAVFLDHSTNIQFQFAPQDSFTISFWFAPFRLTKGASIMGCVENAFSVYVSDINSEYIDAYSAATYTLSLGNRDGNDLDIDLQAKPYPTDTAFFNQHTEWHQLQLFVGRNSYPSVMLNSQPIGEIYSFINPFENKTMLNIRLGGEGPEGNSFCGKVDEFIIQKL